MVQLLGSGTDAKCHFHRSGRFFACYTSPYPEKSGIVLYMPRLFPGFAALSLCFAFLAGASSICAASLPQPAANSPRERGLVAQSLINEKLWMWQRRLNLTSWNITVLFSPPTDLKPRTLGNIHW